MNNGQVVFLKVSCHRLGNTRRLSSDDVVKSDLPQKEVKAGMTLYQGPLFDAICSAEAEISGVARRMSSPSQFSRGVYTVRLERREAIEMELENAKNVWQTRVQAFIAEFEAIIEADQERLGPLALPRTQYPTAEEAAKRFAVDWNWIQITGPTEKDSEKLQNWFQEAKAECRAALAAEFKGIVDHLADTLNPKENGKPRRVFKTLIPNIEEFLANLPGRMLDDDPDLLKVGADLRSLIEDVPTDSLKDADVRKLMAQGVGQIKEALDSAVKERPLRKFNDV